MMRTSDDVRRELSLVHDFYVQQVNAALEEGREALVGELSDAYTDEALAVILGTDGHSTVPGR